jgi:hypothetical protein
MSFVKAHRQLPLKVKPAGMTGGRVGAILVWRKYSTTEREGRRVRVKENTKKEAVASLAIIPSSTQIKQRRPQALP